MNTKRTGHWPVFLRLVRRATNYAKDRASVAIQAAAAVLY
ncbi:hypothetical protein X726_26160 [Mesorhizobium sp. L103C105A0]|nr:hypothetical protein X726_26160 [Mesorhizobium sp. L103C105A0]